MTQLYQAALDGKRILAIDGGGFRGLGCLLILQQIMEEVRIRSRQPLVPCEVFDLICGTSTGGLVAILLGRFGLDCSTAIDVYKSLTIKLFGNDEQKFWDTLLSNPNFDSQAYDDSLVDLAKQYGGRADVPMLLIPDNDDSVLHKTTKTFVTITSDGPEYSSRSHHIRSYVTPARAIEPPPKGHKWLVYQAARATTASSIYLTSHLVQTDPILYGFRDSTFSGHNNPTNLARREAENLWPNDNIGAVVSLGTGFSPLTPTNLVHGWAVTGKYAKPFVSEMLVKTSTSTSGDMGRKRALNLVKELVSMAVETELMHTETLTKIPQTYHRLNPHLGLGSIDLVDCFHADKIEETVKKWLTEPEGKQAVCDIAAKLVDSNVAPIEVAEASDVIPPAPPTGTNIGYNPVLDEPRPKKMIDYLKNYHAVFVVDDSRSMKREGRWIEARDALAGIAEEAIKYDSNGVDLCFFNSKRKCLAVKGRPIIISTFDEVQPAAGTPTGAILKTILDQEIGKLDATIGNPEYKEIKPLDIIVITDGVPSDNPHDVLIEACTRLNSSKHHPNCIGIQFVQIGNDPKAIPVLKELTGDDVGNMVDTVPYDGVLTSEKLVRILLGGIHPNVRALLPRQLQALV